MFCDSLPLEIIKLIAQHSKSVWYLLYLYDESFYKYAISYRGKLDFIQIFTKVIRQYGGEETHLMGYLHSVNDKPSKKFANFRLYHYRGKLNRATDLPTLISSTSIEWHVDDELHRIGLPAYISNNINRWFEHGILIKELFYDYNIGSNILTTYTKNDHLVLPNNTMMSNFKLIKMEDVINL